MLYVISAIHNLCMAAFDISDASLQVEQKEAVLIEVPSWVRWVRVLLNKPSLLYWRLKKCLPGQTKAAMRWCDYFADMCRSHGYENYTGSMLLRHKERMELLSIHIDDIFLVGPMEQRLHFHSAFSQKLEMKMEGPFGKDEPG